MELEESTVNYWPIFNIYVLNQWNVVLFKTEQTNIPVLTGILGFMRRWHKTYLALNEATVCQADWILPL